MQMLNKYTHKYLSYFPISPILNNHLLFFCQDIETTEKKCARQTKLDAIDNNVEVLTQMMAHHEINKSTLTEKDVMTVCISLII